MANTVFYSVDGDGFCESFTTVFDIDDGEMLAEEAAADYHSEHDGWEAKWPLTINIHDGDGGPVVASFSVDREYEPVFSAQEVE